MYKIHCRQIHFTTEPGDLKISAVDPVLPVPYNQIKYSVFPTQQQYTFLFYAVKNTYTQSVKCDSSADGLSVLLFRIKMSISELCPKLLP